MGVIRGRSGVGSDASLKVESFCGLGWIRLWSENTSDFRGLTSLVVLITKVATLDEVRLGTVGASSEIEGVASVVWLACCVIAFARSSRGGNWATDMAV